MSLQLWSILILVRSTEAVVVVVVVVVVVDHDIRTRATVAFENAPGLDQFIVLADQMIGSTVRGIMASRSKCWLRTATIVRSRYRIFGRRELLLLWWWWCLLAFWIGRFVCSCCHCCPCVDFTVHAQHGRIGLHTQGGATGPRAFLALGNPPGQHTRPPPP